MARDIEEFLRRAAERRKQNQQGGAPPPQPPPRQPPPPRQQSPPLRPPPRPAAPPRPMLTISDDDVIEEVEVVEDSRLRSSIRAEKVGRHVRQYLDTSDVTDSASHLAETIEYADDKLRSRLKSTFDHEVGHLDHDTVTDDAPPAIFGGDQRTDVAKDLINMLRSPGGIRSAIMVREILDRPDWDAFDDEFEE